MLRSAAHRTGVVKRDKISLHVLVAAVHQHHRPAVTRGVGCSAAVAAKRVQNKAIDLVGCKRFNAFDFAAAVIA